MGLNLADGFVIVLLIASSAIGVYRGFIREVLTLITWIFAAYLAFMYGKYAGDIFTFIDTTSLRDGLGIALIFFVTLLIGSLIKFLICKAFSIAGPSIVDRIGGFAFGVARACALIIAVFLIAPNTVKEQSWYVKSKIMPTFNTAATLIAKTTPQEWKEEAQAQIEGAVF